MCHLTYQFHAQAKLGELSPGVCLLSLLAFCCYHNQEYTRAAEFYEKLTELCPESEEYLINYVQSLVKGGSFRDASRVAATASMTSSLLSQRLQLLQAQAEMEHGMMLASSTTLSRCLEEDPETIVAIATLTFREGNFGKALETYKTARQIMSSHQSMLNYYIALCHYELSDYNASLALVEEAIDFTRAHQDSEDLYVKETLNLKAVLLYMMRQYDAAKTATTPFDENHDIVAAHNDAIINFAEDPTAGIQKLDTLFSQQSCPPETLGNLLTLCTRHGQDLLAAEIFEANKHLADDLLQPDLFAYFEAVSLSLTCPDEATAMLEAQRAHHILQLNMSKEIISEKSKLASARPATASRPTATSRSTAITEEKDRLVANKDFDAKLDNYMPVLCLQARHYWERREFSTVEHLLRENVDYCSDHDAWLMNMGHVMSAQGDKFESSVMYYERLLERHATTDLFKMPAIALANLCVAYVLSDQNEAAEELLKTIEREENVLVAVKNSGGKIYHSCIVNLCIGSLYCERKNYAFGIDRICKSLEPFEKNVCSDTWFYAKKCLMAFALSLSNQSATIKDDLFRDLLQFLGEMETYGKMIPTENAEPEATIGSEARQLMNIFIILGRGA